MCSHHEFAETLAFDSKRYVGAQIGIYNPDGEKVGKVSHLRNLEYLVVAGNQRDVVRTTQLYVGGTHPKAGHAQLFDI